MYGPESTHNPLRSIQCHDVSFHKYLMSRNMKLTLFKSSRNVHTSVVILSSFVTGIHKSMISRNMELMLHKDGGNVHNSVISVVASSWAFINM